MSQLFSKLEGLGQSTVWSMLLACVAVSAAGQSAVDMSADPHHHLLLQNEQVRVFEVRLRQSEQSFVRHENNFLVVTLTDSDVVMWPEGRSDIESYRFGAGDVRFFFGGRAIGTRNNQTGEYRSITVEFLDPAVTTFGYQAGSGEWNYGDSVLRPPVDPHAKFSNSLDLSAAIASDVQLLAGDLLAAPENPSSELLIAVTDFDLRGAVDLHTRKSSGEVVWLDPGRKYAMRNASAEAARFVWIEIPVKP
jgi:hypothetical protein